MSDTAFIWLSKKQHIVTLSPYEVEYITASWYICHVMAKKVVERDSISLKWSYKDLYGQQVSNSIAKNPIYRERSKHIDVRFHFIRDQAKEKNVQLEYIKSEDQVADIFTKPINSELFNKMKTLLRMVGGKRFGLRGDVGICKSN